MQAPAAGGRPLAGWAGLRDDAHSEWGRSGLRTRSCGLGRGKEARVGHVVKARFQVALVGIAAVNTCEM